MTPIPSVPTTPTALTTSLPGELFSYAPNRVAFESILPPTQSFSNTNRKRKVCILLGGLSDGLWPVPYTAPLAQALNTASWSLVQPILSNSYTGFGHGDLDRDVAELDELMKCLVEDRNCEHAALVGHSTGCQIIVHYLQQHGGQYQDRVVGAALQAPVSDRESAACTKTPSELLQYQAFVELARSVPSRDEMMPRAAFWAPITASRFLDLFDVNGKDDYFSTDLTDEQLQRRLQHIGRLPTLKHVLVACSGMDEYVPINKLVGSYEEHLRRMCLAMNGVLLPTTTLQNSDAPPLQPAVAIPLLLPKGNHNLSSSSNADAATFVSRFVEMLHECMPSRQAE